MYCVDQSDENKIPNIPKRQITDKSIWDNTRSLVDSKVDYQIYSQRTPSTIEYAYIFCLNKFYTNMSDTFRVLI